MWQQVSEDFWMENRESKVGQVEDTVKDIVDQVRDNGDKALRDLAKKFDKIDLKDIAAPGTRSRPPTRRSAPRS